MTDITFLCIFPLNYGSPLKYVALKRLCDVTFF